MFNPCCCSCVYFSDTFNRTDSTNIGADWTETAGGWEILSNELKATTSNALAEHSVSSSENYWISVSVKGESSGDQLRLTRSKTGVKTIIELEVGASAKLRLYSDNGGGEVLLRECSVTAAANTWHTIEWRLGDFGPYGMILVNDSPVFASIRSWAANNFEATEYGLSTGTISTAAYFDNYELSRYEHDGLNTNCEQCETCVFPAECTAPASITVVVAGMVDDGSGDYSLLNGTYSLDYEANCTYRITGLNIDLNNGTVMDELYMNNTPDGAINDDAIRVEFLQSTGTDVAAWRLYADAVFDGIDAICGNNLTANWVGIAAQTGTATVSY